MIKPLKNQKGFTLIELIAVLIVIVAIGSITLSLVISSLRATDKTNVTNIVRQNGNFAIQEMSRRIQYAKLFNGVRISQDQSYTKDCIVPDQTPFPPPTQYSQASFVLDNDTTATLTCDFDSDPATIALTIGDSVGNLISTSQVKLDSCYFTCSQKNYTDPPSIGINFTLSEAGSSNFAEKAATINFATTVTMRNPNK